VPKFVPHRKAIKLNKAGRIKSSDQSGGSAVQKSAGAEEEQRKDFSSRAIIPCRARFYTWLLMEYLSAQPPP